MAVDDNVVGDQDTEDNGDKEDVRSTCAVQ
jgi:hypothetical protein